MSINYTKQQILDKLEQVKENMPLFYNQGFVNYSGKTSDTKEYYTELVAEWLLANLKLLNSIPEITRTASYKTTNHKGTTPREQSNRIEERIAMAMFRHGKLPILGDVIDYQTPLKDIQKNNAGKIDLLTYDGQVLRILELKTPDSKETMLRCVLEAYTYLKTINAAKLLKNFSLPANTKIQACTLVHFERSQHKEMMDHRPYLEKLMKALDCKHYYYLEPVQYLIIP